ncbi:putative solute-binding protein [Aquabacterium sp.]|uniref:putative solute-binding protein n=1 Tax=Aquabacterium sp. TaxID=1872578 RepID=UPI004037717E
MSLFPLKLMKFSPTLLASTLLAICVCAAQAAPNARPDAKPEGNGAQFCVFDPIGSGETHRAMQDYALAMLKKGHVVQLKTYVDERVAVEDFRTGQCDGVMATGLRTRPYMPFSAALDSVGASTIVRNGKVDLKASYEVVRQFVNVVSSPKALDFIVAGPYELAGIAPLGAVYPFVNDRNIDTLEKAAGKRVAAMDYDKAEAQLIQRVGAKPVAADISNFSTMFNNGLVDVIMAPAMVYKPLELYKGIGTKGGVARFPVLILTGQAIIRSARFAKGFGQDSRDYFVSQYETALGIVVKGDREIPEKLWINSTPRDNERYVLLMRQGRVLMAEKGFYDKKGLKLIKKIRCSIHPEASECTEFTENW